MEYYCEACREALEMPHTKVAFYRGCDNCGEVRLCNKAGEKGHDERNTRPMTEEQHRVYYLANDK